MEQYEIKTITNENIDDHPPVCFLNPKHEAYHVKKNWLPQRYKEGFTIKQLYVENDKKAHGFIEYAPGESAWRAVHAPNYLVIHCIWIYPNAYKNQGYGSALIKACIQDAKNQKKAGVAAVTSEGSFMAGKSLFENNGFISTAQAIPAYNLMIYPLTKDTTPTFTDWETKLQTYKGLHALYTKQCPWVIRSIKEIQEFTSKNNIDITITEITSPQQAQQAPSPYASFNLINNGKLLSDHYISLRRFQNILKKEKII